MKPIQQAFRIAQAGLCLANEWRDTLSYGVLAIATGIGIVHGHTNYIWWAAGIAYDREFVRFFAWNCSNKEAVAGFQSLSINHQKNAYAAVTIAASLGLLKYVSKSVFKADVSYSIEALHLAYCAIAYICLRSYGGNIRDIPNLYFDKKTGMWDWPRKRGGGTTQTQKLKNAFINLGTRLVEALPSPHPTYVPIPVKHQSLTVK